MDALKLFAATLQIFLLAAAPLLATSTKPEQRLCGPRPAEEIAGEESLLTHVTQADLLQSGIVGALSPVHAQAPIPWCYPDGNKDFCGWLVPFRFELRFANRHIPPKVRVLFFRNGRLVSWVGSFLDEDDRIVALPVMETSEEGGSSYRADLTGFTNPLNQAYSSEFTEEGTGKTVEVKLSLSDEIRGGTRTYYNEDSLQMGFFLRVALERAGFHRNEKSSGAPDYVLSVDLKGIKTAAKGWSNRTTVSASATVSSGISAPQEEEFEATGPSMPLPSNWDAAMARVAEKIARDLKQNLDTERTQK